MSALSTFIFNGITMRPTVPKKDRALAIQWTRADPEHRETTNGYFWLTQDLGIESYALEDKFGVILFFRMDWVKNSQLEFHIQFPPPEKEVTKRIDQKQRAMRAMMQGFEWMKRILAQSKVNEVFFLSRSPHLIRFSTRHLGFEQRDGKLVYDLASERAKEIVREES